ncbi:MAG: 50S ribosomal protein L21e [Candidatus ainarchaeum sp.]|nr:50S ribosomal protein L21e [Candidatus ainarchaeum sp.]
MVKNSRGFLSGNTKKLIRRKKTTINDVLRSFNIGDKVIISVKSGRNGAPHLRYQGRTGVVHEKRGDGYLVSVKDGNSVKSILATAYHLKNAAHKK